MISIHNYKKLKKNATNHTKFKYSFFHNHHQLFATQHVYNLKIF